MSKVSGTFRLLKTLVEISKFNNVYSNFHRQAKKIVKEITGSFDLSSTQYVPSNASLKIQWYMAEFIYTCEILNTLSGQHSNSKQRRMYLLGGALVAMCDMLIDDVEMHMERIKLLKRPGSDFEPVDTVEKIYVTCYKLFINSLDEELKQRSIDYYEFLFDAQVRSKKQFDQNITRKEVDEICKNKCGFTMLLIRSMVKGEIFPTEKEAWFELGAFVQYCNDSQDMYKDLQKNMRTFATTRPDIETIASDLDKQKVIAFSLIKKTTYPKEKKDELLFTLHVMSISILAKLNVFSRICDYNFSFEALLSKSKKEIRSKLKPIHLFQYAFPKILNYQYENSDKPYVFE